MVEVEESSAPVIMLNPLMAMTSATPLVFSNISTALRVLSSVF